jgi:hypothetical protein
MCVDCNKNNCACLTATRGNRHKAQANARQEHHQFSLRYFSIFFAHTTPPFLKMILPLELKFKSADNGN